MLPFIVINDLYHLVLISFMKQRKSQSLLTILLVIGTDLVFKSFGAKVDLLTEKQEPFVVDLLFAQTSTEPIRQCVCIQGNDETAAPGWSFALVVEADSSDNGFNCPVGTYPATNTLAQLKLLLNECCVNGNIEDCLCVHMTSNTGGTLYPISGTGASKQCNINGTNTALN